MYKMLIECSPMLLCPAITTTQKYI